MLEDITKDILRDIGIVSVGHILLIMKHTKMVGLFIFLAREQDSGMLFFCQARVILTPNLLQSFHFSCLHHLQLLMKNRKKTERFVEGCLFKKSSNY